MEILPITIQQTLKIIASNLSSEEKSFIANSTLNELYEFEMLKELHIDEITGLSAGNRALLEHCSFKKDDSEFITFLSVQEAIDVIVEELIFYLNR